MQLAESIEGLIQAIFSQKSTDFLNFNLGYQFDLYWYDIPLGSFDVGLGFDIYKNKITGSSEKDPRLYVAWVNSLDLLNKKVRDFSEYIELIEVNDELISTTDPIVEEKIISLYPSMKASFFNNIAD